jgi:serine/threonine protein kinase
VISVLDVQADESRCYIVMEKCEGDLLQAISRSAWRRFSEASASNFILQVLAGTLQDILLPAKSYSVRCTRATGLTSCHSRGIFHGDVKPENILLTNTGQVKLCDFLLGDGSSSDLISGRMLGSTVYVAPEVYEHARGRSQARPLFDLAAADVWSLGVTLFAIVAGYIPWHKPDESDADFTRFVADPKGFCPTWFSAPLKSLITSMLQVSPEDRISLSDIWANPWVLHHMVNSSPRFASPFSHVASILIDDGFGVGSPSSQDYTDSEVESDKVVGELVYADAYTDPYTSVCGSPAKATFGARRTDLSPLKRKKQRRLLIPSSPFTPESPS